MQPSYHGCAVLAAGRRSDLLQVALHVSKASAELLMLGFKQSHAMLKIFVTRQKTQA